MMRYRVHRHSRSTCAAAFAEGSFGLLMPKDCALAQKEAIRFSDLKDLPVIVSRPSVPYSSGTAGLSQLNIVAVQLFIDRIREMTSGT